MSEYAIQCMDIRGKKTPFRRASVLAHRRTNSGSRVPAAVQGEAMLAWMGHDGCVDADALVPGPDTPSAALTALRFRVAGPGDAADLRALKENLDRETSFMLLEPAERSTDEQDVAADLATVAGTVNSVVLLAESAGQPVGYVDARGGQFRRNRITAQG